MKMNRNSTYWQNRFKQLEETEHTSSVEEYAKIQEQFDIAQRRIQKEINSWYGRFAKENGVSMEAARKMLDDKEMAELKWDVNEYIKYGQKNAIDPKWMHQLENASARVHISRLEAVKLLTQAECEKLYGNLTDDITHHLSHQYEDAYYHTAYEIAKGTGVGVNFAAVNERKLEKIINKPWAADGKNFAVRLGENKANLINNIHKSLVQMTLTGENPDKAILMLSRTMNGDKARAGRIIMTESAYFTELANKDSYNELGVQQYEIIATLDSHTSEICQEMDGKVLDMKDFEPGVTAPPFHPNCRSTTAPYFEDDFGVVGERAARDEEGKYYTVPANTTYKEWYKGFVGKKAAPEKHGFLSQEKEREYEYGVKYNKDAQKITAEEFLEYFDESKFDGLTGKKDTDKVLAKCARNAVIDNIGTLKENMYLIDADNGEIISAITDEKYKINQGICYPDYFKEALNNARNEKRKIIAIHNHPEGLPPSADDIMKARDNGYEFGLAIGSNGQIYRYEDCGVELTKEKCKEIHDQIDTLNGVFLDPDTQYMEVFKEYNLWYNILK